MSWKDATLHVPLGLAYAAKNTVILVACGVSLLASIPPALFIAAWELYNREVTQEQVDMENDIRTGWDFWNWGVGKKVETLVPIAVLLTLGVLVNERF